MLKEKLISFQNAKLLDKVNKEFDTFFSYSLTGDLYTDKVYYDNAKIYGSYDEDELSIIYFKAPTQSYVINYLERYHGLTINHIVGSLGDSEFTVSRHFEKEPYRSIIYMFKDGYFDNCYGGLSETIQWCLNKIIKENKEKKQL